MSDYICGEDFCEECGDCMACYSGEPCVISADRKHWCQKDQPEEEE